MVFAKKVATEARAPRQFFVLAGHRASWAKQMGWREVSIRRFLTNMKLRPQEVERLELAYKLALRSVNLVDRGDPLAESVAKKVIEIGRTGVRDPEEISAVAIKELRIR